MPPKQQPSKKTVDKAKAKIVEVKKKQVSFFKDKHRTFFSWKF
jgi:hypothetical protein